MNKTVNTILLCAVVILATTLAIANHRSHVDIKNLQLEANKLGFAEFDPITSKWNWKNVQVNADGVTTNGYYLYAYPLRDQAAILGFAEYDRITGKWGWKTNKTN